MHESDIIPLRVTPGASAPATRAHALLTAPIPTAYSDVSLSKGCLVGRVLHSPEELLLAQKLRHRVFVEKLKWVAGRDGLDVDEYDTDAVLFGVFDGDTLLGTVRIPTARL